MNYVVLIAEDDPTGRETLVEAFADKGYQTRVATDGAAALALLKTEEIDLVVTDLVMPRADGHAVVQAAVAAKCPVVLVTAHGTVDHAVKAMKNGVFDFIEKPINLEHLFAVAEKALQMKSLTEENTSLRARVTQAYNFGEMIGKTAAMRAVFDQIKLVAPTDTTVCILGESGTGKELVANAIHQHSRRAAKPFVKVNCAAISEHLLESELFGHEKGAFTGAIKERKGRFELADGGTLLLDEISEMSAALQAKLLRVLQEQRFERVGSSDTIGVDVRVIVATNADLQERIRATSFREDLYYRVSVFPVALPPLRERREDIPLLIDHFIRRNVTNMAKDIRGIAPDALDALTNYGWPGNVRQLQNALERACVMVPAGSAIGLGHLPAEAQQQPVQDAARPSPQAVTSSSASSSMNLPDTTIDELERMAIEQALARHNGNRTAAARALNIGTKTLYRKIEKYRIAQ